MEIPLLTNNGISRIETMKAISVMIYSEICMKEITLTVKATH